MKIGDSAVLFQTRYRLLRRIRRAEEETIRLYPTDKIKSPIHLSIGQEALSVAVCEVLEPSDVAFGTYRGHALYLAKGGSLPGFFAELYGKIGGCAKGKGGSMHLGDISRGFMGTSAVVGTSIPNAVGYALAAKQRGLKTVVVSMFGDGAVEEGVFTESLNFAALKRLPIIFICENNDLAIHSRVKTRQAGPGVVARAGSVGVPASRVEKDSVDEIGAALRPAVAAARAGEGPALFELRTCRWKEHVGPNDDFDKGYRDRAEAEPWLARDPVRLAGEELDSEVREKIDEEVEREVAEAIAFAEQSPYPGPEELLTDVLAEGA